MEQFIRAVESALSSQNWYGALSLALTLPDVAGKIEYPGIGSQKRYSDWFNKYCGEKYKVKIGPDRIDHQFLFGDDCYALRCAFLHEGKTEILTQRARHILDDFIFIEPTENSIHRNSVNNKLVLQVDIFCTDIVNGVQQWMADIDTNHTKQTIISSLMKIIGPVGGTIYIQ